MISKTTIKVVRYTFHGIQIKQAIFCSLFSNKRGYSEYIFLCIKHTDNNNAFFRTSDCKSSYIKCWSTYQNGVFVIFLMFSWHVLFCSK